MAIVRVTGSDRRNLPVAIPKKASTAMDPGYIVIATSGQVDVAVASSVLLLGIATKKIASTDSDYASTTAVTVEQIDPEAVYIIDVGTAGSPTVGTQYDLANAYSIDFTGTTYKQLKFLGYVGSSSSGKAYVTFNPNLL